MASEDEMELGRRDTEMADIGRSAHFDGLEQRQSEIWPWAPGINVPAQDTEIILGNPSAGQFFAARSIQLNVPIPPTPRMHATYSAGRSPSVSLREAAVVQDFMRFPVPPTYMMRSQPTVDSSRRNVPVFGNTLTLPSSVESCPEFSSRLLPQSTVNIQEIPETTQPRAAGGMSPPRTSNGVLTRAQQRKAQQQQRKKQVHTPPIREHGFSAAVEKNGLNQPTYENSQRTTRHSSDSVDAEIASETALKYPAHWDPDKNELEQLLRQIEWEIKTGPDENVDFQQNLTEIGDRLNCAREIITALVEEKRRIQDDNDDLAARNQNLESENIDLAVCKNDLEETCVKVESKYAIVADQFERLKVEYGQTQQNYSALDKLRMQISEDNKQLTQRIQELIQEKQTLSNQIMQLESAQSMSVEEFQKVVQELEQCRIDRKTAEQHAANLAANTRPGPSADQEFQTLRDRLGIYSRKALDMNYDFRSENPPLNNRIFQLVRDTISVNQGPRPSAPPQSAPAPFQFNAAAQPFMTTTPSVPVMPAAVPSGLDSTQPATSQTQQQASANNTPKLPKPRTFSVRRGGDSYMDFKKWAAEVKSYLILSKVDPALWAECATYYLEGFAKQRMWKEFGLYTNQHARKMDFDEFCSFMLEKIIPPRNPALAGMQLERIIYQRGSETLAAFKDRVLDNLQTQKGDVPLADVDYETAKVQFLNKLPGSYKVFIYQQNWVMENPTLDNYQRAAEMYEASHDLGLGESSFRPRTYQFSGPGPRGKSYQRSRSRTRNWAPAPMRGGRAGYRNLSGRRPAGRSPSSSRFNYGRRRTTSRSPSFDRGQNRTFSFAQPASQNNLTAVQCYQCQKFGHMAKDCKGKRVTPTYVEARKSSKSPVRKAKVHSIQVDELDTMQPRTRDNNTGESLDSDSEDFIQGDYPTILETTPSFCYDRILYTYGTRILDELNRSDCVQAVIEDSSEDMLAVDNSVLSGVNGDSDRPQGSKIFVAPSKERHVDVPLMLEGMSVVVKLDCGAAATLLPVWCYEQLKEAKGEAFIHSRMQPSSLNLSTYLGGSIPSTVELVLEFDTGFSRMFIPCAVETAPDLTATSKRAILLGQNAMIALGYTINDPDGNKICPDPATEAKYTAIRKNWQEFYGTLTKPVSEYSDIEIDAQVVRQNQLVRVQKIEELLQKECKRRMDYLNDPSTGIPYLEYQFWLAKLYKANNPEKLMQKWWSKAENKQKEIGQLVVLEPNHNSMPVIQGRRGMVTPTEFHHLYPNEDYSVVEKSEKMLPRATNPDRGNLEIAADVAERKPPHMTKLAVLSREGDVTLPVLPDQVHLNMTVAQYFRQKELLAEKYRQFKEQITGNKTKDKRKKVKVSWSPEVEIQEPDGLVEKQPMEDDGKFLPVWNVEEVVLPGNQQPLHPKFGHRRKFIVLQAKDFINCPNLHGQSFRFKPVPDMQKADLYVADSLVTPDKLGHFSVECYNDLRADRLLKIQKVGRLYRVSPVALDEAVKEITQELFDSCDDAVVDTEILPDLAHMNHIYSPVKRSRKERRAELDKKLNIEKNDLTREDYERVRRLLLEKVDAFSAFPDEIGRTTLGEHDVVLTDSDQRPIVQKCRRLPLALRDEVENHLKELLKLGLIRPSDSDWSHPIVPVRKRDGRIRVCVDYRILNGCTRKDSSPLPNINELIDEAGINGATRFSSMDLMMGYHQVGLTPRAQRYAAFTCHLGQFTYTCMPFGLCNAPATFANLMRKLQATLDRNRMLVYLDDILIATKTVDEHLENLEMVLDKFIEHGLTVKPEKSFFLKRELLYLGFIISADGVKADPQKLKAIKEYPKPQTPKKLRGFYGLCSYYRRFIKDFSKIAKPLTNALKGKPKVITWTFEMDEAFANLKDIMMSPPVLAYPKVNEPYFIYCDGSLEGLGCVLEQLDADEKSHPIAYGSRTLTPQEQNYSATELEAAAVIYALDHFDVYIRNQDCTVISDHSALSSILTSRVNLTNNRQIRWRNRFLGTGVKVKYRPGSHQKVPDGLSRAPLSDAEPSDSLPTEEDPYDDLVACGQAEICTLAEDDIGLKKLLRAETAGNTVTNKESFLKWIRSEQLKDSQLRTFMDFLELRKTNGLIQDHQLAREVAKDCEIVDGILYHGRGTNIHEMQIAVPSQLRVQLLEENHAVVGHFSMEKTFQRMVNKYWWPFMRRDIALYCKSCRICRARQGEQKAWLPPLGHLPVPTKPNDMVGIDLVNMPLSENGYKYIMVMTDILSRKAATAPLYNKTAKEVAENLLKVWFAHEGPPQKILTDRGAEFTSTIFRQLCHLCGVKNLYTTAFHPAGNPITEKFNKLLVDGLTKLKDSRLLSWDVLLPIFTMSYNGTVHRAHGMTPHKVHFGREMNSLSMSPLAAVENPYRMSENTEDFILLGPDIWKAAKDAIEDYNAQTKKYYDQSVKKVCPFRIGDLVWYKRIRSDKLVSPWTGPWKILEIDIPVVKIQFYDPETRKYYVDTAHMSNLSKSNLNPDTTPFPESYQAKGLAKPRGVGRDVNFCDFSTQFLADFDLDLQGDLGLIELFSVSTDISTDICYVGIQDNRTNQTFRPSILHTVFDLHAVVPCMPCSKRFLPLVGFMGVIPSYFFLYQRLYMRMYYIAMHLFKCYLNLRSFIFRVQLSSGMDSEQSSRQELVREAKAKTKEERERARQLEKKRKEQKKSGAKPKTPTGSAKKKTISTKKKVTAKSPTKTRQRQQSQESISLPSAVAAIEVVKVEDEEMETDPSQPPGIIISDHDPDISIMFETEEELYSQYTTEKYWESQVDKVSLIPTYVARNVCKSFDPLNKDLDQELLGLEPLSFYVSMSYEDLDRSLEELKRDPNYNPQVEQYFESLIADHVATFPAERQEMAKECLLKFLYRRMVRYYFGSRLHLRDYIQNNPGVPVEIALDHLYGLGVNTRTNAVLIEDQAESEMWEAEAGAENYEVIEEVECSEGEEPMEAEMTREFDKYYETLIPPKRPPPRVEKNQEAAGIHYPAIVDLVSVQNRRITSTTITNGNENVRRTELYAYWLHQAVVHKQYPMSWQILLPLPAYGSTQTKRFCIGQFFDLTALPVSTERFPGAAILAELYALGWDVSLLYPIMSDQAFANRPAPEVACFLRHVDFMLFLARLGEGRDIVFNEVIQASEFLYFPEFPSVEDFLQLYEWVKDIPEMRPYQYSPESFAGSSMENYNRVKWTIRTFCEQKLNSKTGWNLEIEQLPIGRRRRDVSDLTTEPPPPVYQINRTTKRGIPKWLPPIRTAPPPRKAKYPKAVRSDTVISQVETTSQVSATAPISLGGIGRGIPPEAVPTPAVSDTRTEKEDQRAQFLEKIGKAVSKEKTFPALIRKWGFENYATVEISVTRLLYLANRSVENQEEVVESIYPYIAAVVRVSRSVTQNLIRRKADRDEIVFEAYEETRIQDVHRHYGAVAAVETWLAASLVNLSSTVKEQILLTTASRRAVDIADRIHAHWKDRIELADQTSVEMADAKTYAARARKLTRRYRGEKIDEEHNKQRMEIGLEPERDEQFPPEMKRLVLRDPTPDREVFTPAITIRGVVVADLGWKRQTRVTASPPRGRSETRGSRAHTRSGHGRPTPAETQPRLHREGHSTDFRSRSRTSSSISPFRSPLVGSRPSGPDYLSGTYKRPTTSSSSRAPPPKRPTTEFGREGEPPGPGMRSPRVISRQDLPPHAAKSRLPMKYHAQPIDARSYHETEEYSRGLPPTGSMMPRGTTAIVDYFTKTYFINNRVSTSPRRHGLEEDFYAGPRDIQPKPETWKSVQELVQKRKARERIISRTTPTDARRYSPRVARFTVTEARKFFDWTDDGWAQLCSKMDTRDRLFMVFARSAQDVSTIIHYDFEYLKDGQPMEARPPRTIEGRARSGNLRQDRETQLFEWKTLDSTPLDAQRALHMVFVRFVDHPLVPPRRLFIDCEAGVRWAVDRVCDYKPVYGEVTKYPVIIVVDIEGGEGRRDEFTDGRFQAVTNQPHWYAGHTYEYDKIGGKDQTRVNESIRKMEEKESWSYANWTHESKERIRFVPHIPLAHTFARTIQMQCPDGMQLIFDLAKLAKNPYDPKKFAYLSEMNEEGVEEIRQGEWADMQRLPPEYTFKGNPQNRRKVFVPDEARSRMPTELMALLTNRRTFAQREIPGEIYRRAPILFTVHNHTQDAIKLYNSIGITMCRMGMQDYVNNWQREIQKGTMWIMDMDNFLLTSGYHRDFAQKGTEKAERPAWTRNFGVKNILAYVTEDTRFGERVPYIQERQCGMFHQSTERYYSTPGIREFDQGRPERELHLAERLPDSSTTSEGHKSNIIQTFMIPDLTLLSWEAAQYLFEDAHASWMVLLIVSLRRYQDHCDGSGLLDPCFIETCKMMGRMIRNAMSSPTAVYFTNLDLLNPTQRARFQAFATEWQNRIETAASTAFREWRESDWNPAQIPNFWPGITDQLALSIRDHAYIANDPDGEVELKQACAYQANEWWQNRINSEQSKHVGTLRINGIGIPGIKYREKKFKEKAVHHLAQIRFPRFGRSSSFYARPGAQIRTDADMQARMVAEQGAKLTSGTLPSAEAAEQLSRLVDQLKLVTQQPEEVSPEMEAGREYEAIVTYFWDIASRGVQELPRKEYSLNELQDIAPLYLAPIVKAENFELDPHMTKDFGLAQRIRHKEANEAHAQFLAELKIMKYGDLLLTEPEYLKKEVLTKLAVSPAQADELIERLGKKHFDLRAWYLSHNQRISVGVQVLLFKEILFDYDAAKTGYRSVRLVGPRTDPTKPNLTTPDGQSCWLLVKDEATYAERMATPEDLRAIYDVPNIQAVADDASSVDLVTPGLDNLTVRTDSTQ